MNDENKKLLNEETAREIKELRKLTPGSPEHSAAVESVERLYKTGLEEQKALDQKREGQKDRWTKIVTAVVGTGAQLGFLAVWFEKSLDFEKTGGWSNSVVRNITRFLKMPKN